jgi:predicted SnoaL-like aldol condensation-catalyzing enzyme
MKPTLLILFSLLLPAAAHATVPTTKEERNKAVALRVFEEIFNQGKFSVADEIYAPDFKNRGLNPDGQWVGADLKTDQNAVHDEKKAFPDLKMTVNNMVAEGDLVAVHWTFRGDPYPWRLCRPAGDWYQGIDDGYNDLAHCGWQDHGRVE